MFHKAPSYFLWTLSALFGEKALIDALTAVVRAAGKRGAPCGGPGTVSALISSVTFKLSLEAAAAAAGHVRRAWAAGEEFPPPGARDREGGPARGGPARRDADLGGRSRARRPRARPLLEYLEGRGWEEVISATCELGLCKWKKKTAAYPKCQVKSGSL